MSVHFLKFFSILFLLQSLFFLNTSAFAEATSKKEGHSESLKKQGASDKETVEVSKEVTKTEEKKADVVNVVKQQVKASKPNEASPASEVKKPQEKVVDEVAKKPKSPEVKATVKTPEKSVEVKPAESEPVKAQSEEVKKEPQKDWHEILPDLTFGATYRLRAEFRDNFAFGAPVAANNDQFLLHQLRINLKWAPTDWFSAFIETQDARIFGSDSVNTNFIPTFFHDQFDIHQAFFDLKFPIKNVPVTIRTGRQKLSFGNQRLVGAFEWANTARVFDAVRVTIGKKKERTLDLFASRLVGVDGHGFNDWESQGNRYSNSDFHGIYLTDWQFIPYSRLEAYYLFRHESDIGDRIHTIGTRLAVKKDRWDGGFEVAGQIGDFGAVRHGAFASHAEIGYTFDFHKTRLGLGSSIASGDADATDSKHHTFDNLFPTNHAFYGYMDFMSLQNVIEIEASLKTELIKNMWFRAAWHHFWLVHEDSDALYNASLAATRVAAGDVHPYVGSELDLTLTYPVIEKRLKILMGYSHFFIGPYIENTGTARKDPDFVYLQSKLTV